MSSSSIQTIGVLGAGQMGAGQRGDAAQSAYGLAEVKIEPLAFGESET